jgi:hypothetical protein
VVRGGAPFGPTCFLMLLRVADRERRDALMRRAIRGRWSSEQLERAIQGLAGGRRTAVGRRPRVPDDPRERLMALDALTTKWTRWADAALPSLPARLRKHVREAKGALERLNDAVPDAVSRLKGGPPTS